MSANQALVQKLANEIETEKPKAKNFVENLLQIAVTAVQVKKELKDGSCVIGFDAALFGEEGSIGFEIQTNGDITINIQYDGEGDDE